MSLPPCLWWRADRERFWAAAPFYQAYVGASLPASSVSLAPCCAFHTGSLALSSLFLPVGLARSLRHGIAGASRHRAGFRLNRCAGRFEHLLLQRSPFSRQPCCTVLGDTVRRSSPRRAPALQITTAPISSRRLIGATNPSLPARPWSFVIPSLAGPVRSGRSPPGTGPKGRGSRTGVGLILADLSSAKTLVARCFEVSAGSPAVLTFPNEQNSGNGLPRPSAGQGGPSWRDSALPAGPNTARPRSAAERDR